MTPKRAGIYIRVSSEHQADKASPEEQEKDCRQRAAEHGHSVIRVYRDVEKYRVKGRLVEPSGTRSDRPALLAMLRDSAAGEIDVIYAWREDRLYRGLRPMLLVLEHIQEHKLDIVLARETFDAKMAPFKAAIAAMELEGMRERMTMGVKARLRAGKANTGQDMYGYRRSGEAYEVVEAEAYWVQQIAAWYIERRNMQEIRRRLIEGGAPQKGSSTPRKIQWAVSSIQSILKHADTYATGVKRHSRSGETFEIATPPILDLATWERVKALRQENRTHKVRPMKREWLAVGLVYCDCGRRWGVRANSYTRKNRAGAKVPRQTFYPTYYCQGRHADMRHPDCPKTMGGKRLDAELWAKVCKVLDEPEILIAGARQQVDELLQKAGQAEAEADRLQAEIDAVQQGRQWVITQARNRRITDEDMDTQLAALTIQEAGLKRELVSYSAAVELAALEGWEDQVREYLADIRAGLDSLNVPPQNDEEAREQFELRRQIVTTLVERVHIGKGRKLDAKIRLDVLAALAQWQGDMSSERKKAGTCNHKPASPGGRLRAACA
jgi:DNA invertase Pin-like site-specific DNA recombinase